MGFIAAIAAVISYNDGLTEMRHAGAAGGIALLYPLLPDGLIVICLMALYQGARMRPEPKRPGWATAGLILGAGLTLAQNVGAGAGTGVLLAVIDGFVPVVFFVAAEVLIWTIRTGRAKPAATVPGCAHKVGDPADAIRVAVEHARECLDEKVTIRGLSRQLGVDHRKVSVLARQAASNGHGGTP
jgi:hypothetical protein